MAVVKVGLSWPPWYMKYGVSTEVLSLLPFKQYTLSDIKKFLTFVFVFGSRSRSIR